MNVISFAIRPTNGVKYLDKSHDVAIYNSKQRKKKNSCKDGCCQLIYYLVEKRQRIDEGLTIVLGELSTRLPMNINLQS